jgi:hypothetical protein
MPPKDLPARVRIAPVLPTSLTLLDRLRNAPSQEDWKQVLDI